MATPTVVMVPANELRLGDEVKLWDRWGPLARIVPVRRKAEVLEVLHDAVAAVEEDRFAHLMHPVDSPLAALPKTLSVLDEFGEDALCLIGGQNTGQRWVRPDDEIKVRG